MNEYCTKKGKFQENYRPVLKETNPREAEKNEAHKIEKTHKNN